MRAHSQTGAACMNVKTGRERPRRLAATWTRPVSCPISVVPNAEEANLAADDASGYSGSKQDHVDEPRSGIRKPRRAGGGPRNRAHVALITLKTGNQTLGGGDGLEGSGDGTVRLGSRHSAS